MAIAEIIDNSIAADARRIALDTYFAGPDSWIRISDDGNGMTEGTLLEAMRFGTRRAYRRRDLGKFGLGLKAASLSQCRQLIVATRSTSHGPTRVAAWDLDRIVTTDQWQVLRLSATESPLASQPLRHQRGTVVLWSGLDRVLRFRAPDGKRAESDFARLTSEVADHLAMTFHRFLSGESRRKKPLEIRINGRNLRPWDPFARAEPRTLVLKEQNLSLIDGRSVHRVVIRPFVLPPEASFSSPAAHRAAAGPLRWNRQQGFYFYRNDRLIQSGGWSRIRTSDEHTKLARISVEFADSADELFELNVSKTQVRVPSGLRGALGAIASSVARVAQDAYRSNLNPASEADQMTERIDAVRELIEIVMSEVQTALDEELGRDSPIALRLSGRLSALAILLASSIARTGIAKSGRQPTPFAAQAASISTNLAVSD